MSAERIILHPTDFGPNSTKAFHVAGALARDRHAKLVVLHVAPRPLTTFGGTEALPPQDVEFDLKEPTDRLAMIPPPAAVPMETRLEVGEVSDTILAVAKDLGCEMIVMGTHGRSGVSRLVMGSVAEEVVRRAPCPVLTLRADATAAA
jgi:nucleotide-binding universal stress UspA family protein